MPVTHQINDTRHIPVAVLWQYTTNASLLNGPQRLHLQDCAVCIFMLGRCCMSDSLRQVGQRMREECGRDEVA